MDRDAEIVVYRGGDLTLGEHVYVGHGTTIACAERVQLGANTLVGDLVSVRDMNHLRIPGVPLRLSGMETRPVRIGKNCCVGSKVTFVAGAELGDDVTVAANAVVAGKFGDGVTIGGVPAHVLRHLAETTAL
jgi:acetyltransferase-like isoleucine patch superfamily enzyme